MISKFCANCGVDVSGLSNNAVACLQCGHPIHVENPKPPITGNEWYWNNGLLIAAWLFFIPAAIIMHALRSMNPKS